MNSANPRPHMPANPTSSNNGYYGPAPMDLSARRGRITDTERARRRSARLCLYCGGVGHIVFSCPNKRGNPVRGNAGFMEQPSPQEEVAGNQEEPKN
ncbi:hypothetical protein EX30DRAFT_45749 [Ascodesmis nigricans]|uniref:CCHC-type domain-containing protein n=1 Tax=Ascodesmis nigricans TaxID=341454 RepID=A0A4S2MP88_9PEZI|nr:hypothetical protein EX30DRAFT_45749 [Ascodesmis nigricans]